MHVHCDGSYNNGRQQEGVQKEEIQQCGTNTLMRTAKKSHNFILWEKLILNTEWCQKEPTMEPKECLLQSNKIMDMDLRETELPTHT